jgi:predicted DNA-binding transcriptional regulator YafY
LNGRVASRTSRLLTLLELLQNHGHATGGELAYQLGVEQRTLRRDIAALQELGIPIEGQRGVGGGYRIRPGYRLPPLMLAEDEVLAVVLGLLETRASRRAAASEAVEGALAKIYRVLPPTLRRQAAALEATVRFTGSGDTEPIRGDVALQLAEAIRRGRKVNMRYTAYDGTSSSRRLSPYGLVVHCGFWYLIAHDHTRDALRTFRVDRIKDARLGTGHASAPPPDFDAVTELRRSLASVPGAYHVSVHLELPLEVAHRRLPDSLGVLTTTDDGVRLDVQVESLDWIARVIAGLGCGFTIERPAELRATIAALAGVLHESAHAGSKEHALESGITPAAQTPG